MNYLELKKALKKLDLYISSETPYILRTNSEGISFHKCLYHKVALDNYDLYPIHYWFRVNRGS